MRLVDVNVLVYAFREDAPAHVEYRRWVEASVQAHEAYAVSDQVLSGFLRIVTRPRVFHPPTPIEAAVADFPGRNYAVGMNGNRFVFKQPVVSKPLREVRVLTSWTSRLPAGAGQ
jgi:predicted nucleic acid-binding protein